MHRCYYCNMMEENGMVAVADCMDATDTEFYNGFLARKDILEERYDDVVLFLQGCTRLQKSCRRIRSCAMSLRWSSTPKTASLRMRMTWYETEVRPFLVPDDFRQVITTLAPVRCR